MGRIYRDTTTTTHSVSEIMSYGPPHPTLIQSREKKPCRQRVVAADAIIFS